MQPLTRKSADTASGVVLPLWTLPASLTDSLALLPTNDHLVPRKLGERIALLLLCQLDAHQRVPLLTRHTAGRRGAL